MMNDWGGNVHLTSKFACIIRPLDGVWSQQGALALEKVASLGIWDVDLEASYGV